MNSDERDKLLDRIYPTKDQSKAIRKLERAFKACYEANVLIHNCYGTLHFYNGNVVDCVNNDTDEFTCNNGNKLIEQYGYHIDSFADDMHYIHLK